MRELEIGSEADYQRAVLYQRRGSVVCMCIALRRARRYAAAWGEVCARRCIIAARTKLVAQERTGAA